MADLITALWGNAVSLWSGVIGLVFTLLALIFWYRNVEQWQWFVAAGIVSIIIAPYAALIEEHRIRLELEKVRPHVLIQAAPVAMVRAYSLRDPRNPVFPEAAYLPGYILGQGPNADSLLYSVVNLGEVTAREIKYFCRIRKIDEIGPGTDIRSRSPEPPNRVEVLLSKQLKVQITIVPAGIFYVKSSGASNLRVTLVVAYSGQPSDKNRYFYRVVLNVKPFAKSPEELRPGDGGIVEDASDEGIVTNMDDLLQREEE